MRAVNFIDLNREIREDPQGFSFFPLTGRVQQHILLPRTLHLVSIQAGKARGNHIHPGHEEWLYPFHGTGVFRWEHQPGEVKERQITGNRILIQIPPGVAHALHNPGPGILYILVWREPLGPKGDEPETVARPI